MAGNFHVSPDAFRERGYSGFLTWAPDNQVELGVSSLVLGAQSDVATALPTTRQAHGVFSRVSPVSKLALLGEANVLVTSAGEGTQRTTDPGMVLDLHADWEAAQGVHLKAGGEVCNPAFGSGDGSAGRGWGAVQWFFAPHINLRVDALYGPLNCVPTDESRPMALAQLHAFL